MSLKISIVDEEEMKPRITIFGVGGAGGNAVNNMIASNLEGVEFWVANTDAQALEHSSTVNRIQLGSNSTKGLGAGSHPEVGKQAAEESLEDIKNILSNANMVFITAGMGGGTGTGSAPVVAKQAKEMNILTVGVVTKPFHFEGARRMKVAELGLEELNKYVDTLIVIPNQNLFRIANENTTFADAFKMADNVLHSGVRGITDLITMPGLINLDFADIRTVMSEMGKAMMGTGEAEGENRAILAAEAAISNPLLDHSSMKGAKAVLINVTGGSDMTLFQVDAAANRIREEVDPSANIIFGSAFNPNLEGKIRVSVVATGIDSRNSTNVNTLQSKQVFSENDNDKQMPKVTLRPFSSAGKIQEESEDEREGGAFIPPRSVEPSNYNTVASNDSFVGQFPQNDKNFDEKIVNIRTERSTSEQDEDKMEEEINDKAKAKNSRFGEDLFDIPALLRRKMKL